MPVKSYYESNPLSMRWRSNLAKMVIALLPEGWAEMNLLDIGSGDGYTMRIVKPQGLFSGVDVDVESVKQAVGRGIDAKVSSAYSLPWPDSSFDVVTCIEVLEHLEKPEVALVEISRVLRQGGFLVATTPVPSLRWEVIWWVWSRIGPGRRWKSTPHIDTLHVGADGDEDGLRASLRKEGLVVQETRKCNYGMIAGLRARKEP